MYFINHNHGIIKELVSILVGGTGVLLQFITRNTVVTDERNPILNCCINLLTNVNSLLGSDLLIVEVGGLVKVRDPDHTAFLFTAENTVQELLGQGEDVPSIHIDGCGLVFGGKGLGDPMIVDVEVTEATEGNFGDEVRSQGKGGHDDDPLVGRAIECLGGSDGGTCLA